MLVLLAATKEEIAGVKKRMAIEATIAELGCPAFRGKYRGKEALLVQSGIGRERVETAARMVMERYPVTALVSFGLGGALTAESSVGDIVLCSVLGCEGQADSLYHGDADLLAKALQVLMGKVTRLREGKSVSDDRIIGEPEIRWALGKAHNADVVDMESYWIARLAVEKQVPFLAVLAISDVVGEKLLPLDRMLGPDGGLRWPKAIAYFAAHPTQLGRLWTARRNMRQANANLVHFLDQFVERV